MAPARSLSSNRIVPDVIFFFVFVKIILYYCLPTLMRIASHYQFESEDRVAYADLVKLYCIECVSWAFWAIALLGTLGWFARPRHQLTTNEMLQLRRRESTTILVVLTLGFVALQISSLAGLEFGPVFEVFKSLFFYGGLVSGPFLMVLAPRHFGKLAFLLGLTASLLALVSLSTRGAILYLMLFALFLVWSVLRDRKSKAIVVGGFILLSVSYFVFGGIFSGSIVMDDSGQPSVDFGVHAEKRQERSPLQEVEWRFGASTRMGTAFLRLYDRGDGAGFNPIKHSLQGFLPRSMDPDKPQPSTLNGDDIYTQGMYVIAGEIVGYDSTSMVEFPTGAHFYWEFGLLGVLVLSAVSGVYIGLCSRYFSRLGIVAVPLIVTVFKPWGYVDPKIWVSDAAMQLYQIILPLIALVFAVRFVHGAGALLRYQLRSGRSVVGRISQGIGSPHSRGG